MTKVKIECVIIMALFGLNVWVELLPVARPSLILAMEKPTPPCK